MKKLAKKQTGGMSPGQAKEARRDSLYKAAAAKTKARMDAMNMDVVKVNAPVGKDTARVGSVRITVAKKQTGGPVKKDSTSTTTKNITVAPQKNKTVSIKRKDISPSKPSSSATIATYFKKGGASKSKKK